MPLTIPTEQKDLKAFVDRRHPEYDDIVGHWDFLQATYQGGRAWFADNIFRYIKEGDKEFKDRLERAYRFNHSREVVDLVDKYIFREAVIRNRDDAPPKVRDFWKQATRDGHPIDIFMRRVSQKSSIFGRVWIVVDNNAPETPLTVAEEREMGARVYAYTKTPQQVLDLSYDDMGELNWILFHEAQRSDEDPFDDHGEFREMFRLWTREEWVLFERRKERRKVVVEVVDQGGHGLGIVPAFPVDHMDSEDPYAAPSLIGDIAYLDRAVANYLSNLDAIIQDQSFSQLVMPAQGVLPGEDTYNKLLEMGTKRIFIYDGEGGTTPGYISPDPKQANVIIGVINKIISEVYHTVGMAGERTKQDNAVGIDNSSGVAKAYDFERMNSLLVSKAGNLDRAENRLISMVQRWNGEPGVKEDLVKYPDSYDVRGLYDEFEMASQLSLVEAPESVRRHQMKSVIDKLFPRLAKELKKKMLAELEDWPAAQETASPPSLVTPSENRQGQVVGDDSKEAQAA